MTGKLPGRPILAAAGLAAGVLLLLWALIPAGAGSALAGRAASLFAWTWNPGRGEFGLLPMVVGSLSLALPAALLAWPLALGLCALLVTGGRPGGGAWPRRGHLALRLMVRFMTAVPTVVYGFVAIFLLAPLMRSLWGGGSGLGLVTACLTLTLLIMPTMVLLMEAGLHDRYDRLRLDAAALGFSRLRTFAVWTLPNAVPALISALLLGFGRALGDTLIALMLSGNAPQAPSSLAGPFRALTAHMALVTANEAGGAAYDSLFAAGAILMCVSCGVSLALRRSEPGPDRV